MAFFLQGFRPTYINILTNFSKKYINIDLIAENLVISYLKFSLIGEKYKRIKIAPLINPPI